MFNQKADVDYPRKRTKPLILMRFLVILLG